MDGNFDFFSKPKMNGGIARMSDIGQKWIDVRKGT